MGIVEIGKDNQKMPPVICSYCKKKNYIDAELLKPLVAGAMKVNCQHCRGELWLTCLMIGSKTQGGLLNRINEIIELFNPKQTTLVDNPNYKGN